MAIQLGSKVKDAITGFEGIAIGRHEYLTGCTRITIQPQSLDKATGKPIESQWFDEQQLEVLDAPPLRFDNGSTPGGPADMPRPSL